MEHFVITGALGRLGSCLRKGLASPERTFTLIDVIPAQQVELAAGEGYECLSVQALEDLTECFRGANAVIHLAAVLDEGHPWQAYLDHNIDGTYKVFEAARLAGVPRLIYASSCQVVGFYPVGQSVGIEQRVRPSGLYAATKVWGEALARLYSDKWGMSVACLRIGSFQEAPRTPRHLSTWLSPKDSVSLFVACLNSPYSFVTVYGVSNNAELRWINPEAAVLDYCPEDRATADTPGAAMIPEDPIGRWFNGGTGCCDVDFNNWQWLTRIQDNASTVEAVTREDAIR